MKISNKCELQIARNFQRKARRSLIADLQRIKMTGQAGHLRDWIEQQQTRRTENSQ